MDFDNFYQVTSKYAATRLPDSVYKIRDKIAAKWTPLVQNADVSFCSKYSRTFYYSKTAQKFLAMPEGKNPWELENDVGMYGVISSADMLYRLACTFKPIVEFDGPGGYKSVWSAAFAHKSGAQILFYEWKGGVTFGARGKKGEILPASKALLKDVLQLLNYLCSDKCVHPYDGCRAGSVA